jgi:hypothetical protein
VTSPRNYLLVFLALTTLGGAALALKQHLEITRLNAVLQEKDLDAQLHQHEFETKLAAAQAGADKKTTASTDDAASQSPADDQHQPGRSDNMQAMTSDSDSAKLMAMARLDRSYGPLFKQLNLSPAQLAAFQNLLVEKQSAARDVLIAARDQGLNLRTDRAEIAQLVAQSNAEVDNQIQSTLGPDDFAQYQGYEQTLPERNTVSRLQQMMSSTNTPIPDQEVQPLIDALAGNAPKNAGNPTTLRALLGGPNRTAPITAADVPIIAELTGIPPPVIQNLLPALNTRTNAGNFPISGAPAGR